MRQHTRHTCPEELWWQGGGRALPLLVQGRQAPEDAIGGTGSHVKGEARGEVAMQVLQPLQSPGATRGGCGPSLEMSKGRAVHGKAG